MYNDNLNQLTADNCNQSPVKLELSIDAVDKLANELTDEYDNHKFRLWYCKIIYKFGVDQVSEWRNSASTGKYPARLFSTYVKQAECQFDIDKSETRRANRPKIDEVFYPLDEDLTDEAIEKSLDEAVKRMEGETPTHPKAIPRLGEDV